MKYWGKIKPFFAILLTGIWLMTGCDSGTTIDSDVGFQGQMMADSKEIGKSEEEIVDKPNCSFSLDELAELDIPEDMLAYWMVLNNKRPFVSADEGYQEFFWDEYYWCLGMPRERRQADYFMIVDMNGDKADEIVLGCSPESTQILYYEDGVVYSYQFVFRGMMRIRVNGIYEGSDGAASTFYYRLRELSKDGYAEEVIAGMDGDYYEVGGREATYEEFCNLTDSIESVALAKSMEFTERMLDQCLLGDLSEQELTLLKRIPKENVAESEPNHQEVRQALQAYAAVLKGEQDVIPITGSASVDAEADVLRYFSLTDMDGDGEQELILTCNGDFVWVLHRGGERVYGYRLRTDRHKWRVPVIATDGVFQTEDGNLSSTGYARIVEFGEDGYRTEPVEGRGDSSHDWIRYYFYSEETIAQWLE